MLLITILPLPMSLRKTRLFKYIENFTSKKQTKNSDIFHISPPNIDCGYSLEPPRQGGSNEYPQSMFLSRSMKNNVYPENPSFTTKKWGLRGSKLYRHVFVMEALLMSTNNICFCEEVRNYS